MVRTVSSLHDLVKLAAQAQAPLYRLLPRSLLYAIVPDPLTFLLPLGPGGEPSES